MNSSKQKSAINSIYHGLVCLHDPPITKESKPYPFRFNYDIPIDAVIPFRCVSGVKSAAENTTRLKELLQKYRELRAKLDKLTDHPIAFLTVYFPKPDGGTAELSGEVEPGTTLYLELPNPAHSFDENFGIPRKQIVTQPEFDDLF